MTEVLTDSLTDSLSDTSPIYTPKDQQTLQVRFSNDKFSVSPRSPLYATNIEENLWVCGHNSHGQLTDLGKEVKSIQRIKGVKRVSQVSVNDSHAAAVSSHGELYVWGNNDYGQLGFNNVKSAVQPTKLPQLAGITVRGVSCGGSHTLAITDSDVVAWGNNDQGQLGYGESSGSSYFKPCILLSLHDVLVHQVACGRAHSLCITAQSHVYAWGCNSEGQLGLGDRQNRKTPTLVNSLWALPIVQLEAGSDHSLALTSNGFLFAWGDNSQGQVGVNANAELAGKEERKIDMNLVRKEIAKKVDQSMVGSLLGMGISKEDAELALYHTSNKGVELAIEFMYSPHWDRVLKQLQDLDANFNNNVKSSSDLDASNEDSNRFHTLPRRVPLKGVQFIAAGSHHTIAVTGRNAYAWGCNTHGQLGLGHQQFVYAPNKIGSLNQKFVVSAACGSQHTLFLARNGEVYGCGSFDYGQLGIRFKQRDLPLLLEPQLLPLALPTGQNGQVVNSLVAGGNVSMFITRGTSEFPAQIGPLSLNQRLSQLLLEYTEQRVEDLVSMDFMPLLQMLKLVYSSAAAMTATFGKSNGAGLNFDFMEHVQQRLGELDEVILKRAEEENEGQIEVEKSGPFADQILECIGVVVKDLEAHHKLLGFYERVQVVLVLLQLPMLPGNQVGRDNIPLLAQAVLMAPSAARRLLIRWWSEIPAEPLKRMVQALQWFLTDDLMTYKKLKPATMNSIKLLARIEEANRLREASVRLPPETFYNQLISEKMDVMDHYSAWRQSKEEVKAKNKPTEGPFSFCSYPFLLDAKAKSKLLHTEARMRMQQTVAEAKIEQMYQPFRSQNNETLQEGLFMSPLQKASIFGKTPLPDSSEQGKDTSSSSANNGSSSNGKGNGSGNRRIRGDLRRFIYGMIGRSSSVSSEDVVDDERRIVARELSHTELVPRLTSLNFPQPSECSVPGTHPEYCILRIRRNHLVEDAANEMARQKVKDLFKPLRVHFIGEDGIDAGGVKKEFFQLLATELLSPDYGLLVYLPESRTYWLNSASKDMSEEYKFLGVMLGLAIYNGVILDLPLPVPLYKKILNQVTVLRDLQEMQPTVAASLQAFLDYNESTPMEDVFCQTFTISEEHYGTVMEYPLIQNGEDVFVTEENRLEYVNLYVDWVLDKSVKQQFEALQAGFMLFYDGPAITLFSAEELDRLVCGTPQLDFQALREKCKYEGDYCETSRAVKWLWEIVFNFNEEEGKMFLKFFTGSSRAPIGGLGNLKCLVQRDGRDSNKLPTSHTCFNTLLLPDYESKEKMERLIKLAIMNSEGFGLE